MDNSIFVFILRDGGSNDLEFQLWRHSELAAKLSRSFVDLCLAWKIPCRDHIGWMR